MKVFSLITYSMPRLLIVSLLCFIQHSYAADIANKLPCYGESSIDGWSLRWSKNGFTGTVVSPLNPNYINAGVSKEYSIEFYPARTARAYEEKPDLAWRFTRKDPRYIGMQPVIGATLSVDGAIVSELVVVDDYYDTLNYGAVTSTPSQGTVILAPVAIKALATGSIAQIESAQQNVKVSFSLKNWRKAMGISYVNDQKAKTGMCK